MQKIIIKALVLSFILFPFSSSWAEDEPVKKAVYYTLPDPFTINFLQQSNKKVRYLQIKVALMSHDPTAIAAAETNLPMIQDALRNLFTEQSMEAVSSVEGRKKIQASALEAIKGLLKEETGNDQLEKVYFTSFILQ